MRCVKCGATIPNESIYCLFCGKKQTKTAALKMRKRANGTGTVYKKKGRKTKPWIAELNKVYLGSFATAAEGWDAVERARKRGVSDKYNATLGDVYESWRAIYFDKLGTKAQEEKRTAWKRLSVLKDRKMRDLKTSDYENLIENAMTMEQVRKDGTSRPPKPLSVSGKQNLKKLCSQLCKHAMRDDIIDKNYAALTSPLESDSVQKDVFSQNQIDLMWKHTDDLTIRIILILIYTGLRINELFTIELDNVYLDKRYMTGGLKTEAGRNRFVPINKKIMPFVREFYEDSQRQKGQYLILNAQGRKMDASHFRNKKFYPALERMGIIEPAQYDDSGHLIPRKITPHSTRYTFWNMSRNSGADPELLTLIMGHEEYEESLDMYGKLTEQDRQKMARIVDAL